MDSDLEQESYHKYPMGNKLIDDRPGLVLLVTQDWPTVGVSRVDNGCYYLGAPARLNPSYYGSYRDRMS